MPADETAKKNNMDRLRRVYKLHQALQSRRRPVPLRISQQELECSRASVIRMIRDLRLFFGAPLEYDRQANGYHYAQAGDSPFELPGLWFTVTVHGTLIPFDPFQSSPARKRGRGLKQGKIWG